MDPFSPCALQEQAGAVQVARESHGCGGDGVTIYSCQLNDEDHTFSLRLPGTIPAQAQAFALVRERVKSDRC